MAREPSAHRNCQDQVVVLSFARAESGITRLHRERPKVLQLESERSSLSESRGDLLAPLVQRGL
jgi:hypothetical protein